MRNLAAMVRRAAKVMFVCRGRELARFVSNKLS